MRRKPKRIPITDRNSRPVYFTLKKGQNTSGTIHYRITGTLHKEHVDKKFRHEAYAEQFIRDLQKQEDAARSKQNSITTTLTNQQVNDATAAFDRLPEDISLVEVVQFYLQHKPQEQKTVQAAFDFMILEKKRLGRRAKTLAEAKGVLSAFVKSNSYRLVSSISESDVTKYIQLKKLSAQSQNNRLRVFNVFFNFCIKHEWLSDNPLKKLDPLQVDSGPVEYFAVKDAEKVLRTAVLPQYQDLLPYIVLMLFCGLRNSEALLLDWSKIVFDGDRVNINIDAHIAKKKSRRSIEVEENAARMLKKFRKENSVSIRARNFDKRMRRLKEESGVEWSTNILRHTFATYRISFLQSMERTSMEMGNSVDVLNEHYKGLATRSESREFFEMEV